MTQETSTPVEFPPFHRNRTGQKAFPRTASGAVALGFGVLAGAWVLDIRPAATPGFDRPAAPAATVASVSPAGPPIEPGVFDPGFSLGVTPAVIGQNAPLEARFTALASATPVMAMADATPASEETVEETLEETPQELAQSVPMPTPVLALNYPLPPSRPAGLSRPIEVRSPANPLLQLVSRPVRVRQSRTATVAAAPPPERRNFFERLFGSSQPQPRGPALAYAPQDSGIGSGQGSRFGSGVGSMVATAVYDITARTVYLPNGEKLEAHSGLGERRDDPTRVHERMKGATPPNVYHLTMREQPFHGVRALRLTPVSAAGTYGRTGLLAHSYLLGPNGDSNGCVSVKDYDKFLQAYLRGEIKRLVVVARMS